MPKENDGYSGVGFSKPEMEEHKLAGMAAAAEAPNTPEHLRPHLRNLAGTSTPDKGTIVLLADGRRGGWNTVHRIARYRSSG